MGEQDQQTRQRLLRCAKAEFLTPGGLSTPPCAASAGLPG